jgi:chromosome segregation ATPase
VGEDHTGEPRANHERLTVAQAATRLGITEGAVRSRIKRGTLTTTKEGGTVFVLLGDGTSQANQTTNTGVPGDQSELIASLQDQVHYLREQLDAEREARTEERRRHDTVLAQLSAANAEQARTIRAIEAPQEAPEDAETVEEATDGAEPHSATEETRDELGAERTRRETAETTLQEGMAEERLRREEAERERDELRRELVGIGRRTEAHEEAEEQQGRGEEHRSATGGALEGERRPWWRRVFGG